MTQSSAVKKKSSPKRPPSPLSQVPILGWLAIGGLLALSALVIYAVYESTRPPQPIEGLEQFSNMERNHKEGPLTYAQTPPVGGNHNPVWQNCGVYSERVANENAVHSLEHGAIWITYRPDLSPAEVGRLQSLTRQSAERLLSPYPDLPSPIVASAWGYQLKLDSADDSRLAAFIERYENNPKGPESAAPCSGGTGRPQ